MSSNKQQNIQQFFKHSISILGKTEGKIVDLPNSVDSMIQKTPMSIPILSHSNIYVIFHYVKEVLTLNEIDKILSKI